MLNAKQASPNNTLVVDYSQIENLLEEAQSALFSSVQKNVSPSDKNSLLNHVKVFAEDVLSLDADNKDAHHMLALSHTLLGESSRAKKHMMLALEEDTASIALRLQKAHIDLAAGHYNKAEQAFTAILQESKSNAEAFLGLAIIKQRRKDYGGAFLHYSSLINKGYVNQTVITGLSSVAPYVCCDRWSAEFENTVVMALTWPNTDPAPFAKLINSLLISKYALDHQDSKLDFALLLNDSLLQAVVDERLLCSVEVEQLLTLIRETLLLQIAESGAIMDELQQWIISLGEAAAHYGYCWPYNHNELQVLQQLEEAIKQSCRNKASCEDLVGAMMLYGMYEDFYSASFSSRVLAFDLQDWPSRLQPLMAISLYEPSRLHMTEVELKQVIYASQSLQTFERSLSTVYPKWTHLGDSEEQSANHLLTETFGDAIPFKAGKKRPLSLLVTSCKTGQAALQEASQFNDVLVTGADHDIAKLAFAEYQARNHDIDSVRWVQCAEDKLTCLNQRFDIVEWTSPLNNSSNLQETLAYIKKLMAPHGLCKVRIEINRERNAENTLKQLVQANNLEFNKSTIRQLRKVIMDDANENDWTEILAQDDFYHAGGCEELFFGATKRPLNAIEIDEAFANTGIELFGIVDHEDGKISQLNRLTTWEMAQPLVKEPPRALTLFCKVA
ncbi:tetratricopeptide repeat protein [Hahella ganghwensis]|uniref:tetratricopeptide repeat protein n=1 Tax=Hahella ganghwensis TaxID=286420 RepID=UPI00036B921B|nr:hypothetical protein [Hahella ganghwensis]